MYTCMQISCWTSPLSDRWWVRHWLWRLLLMMLIIVTLILAHLEGRVMSTDSHLKMKHHLHITFFHTVQCFSPRLRYGSWRVSSEDLVSLWRSWAPDLWQYGMLVLSLFLWSSPSGIEQIRGIFIHLSVKLFHTACYASRILISMHLRSPQSMMVVWQESHPSSGVGSYPIHVQCEIRWMKTRAWAKSSSE